MHEFAPCGRGFSEIANLLARAYLRLAEKQRHGAIFDPKKVQKPLEVCAPASPDGVTTPEVAP